MINQGLIQSSGKINLLTGGTVLLRNGATYTQADAKTIENGISETASLIRNSGTIRATGAMEVGGEVYLVAPGGKVFNEGMITANKTASKDNGPPTVGGKVVLTGTEVELAGAKIDVSGRDGGGDVYIGGGFQGKDPSILNAESTSADQFTSITADALVNGNGGEVVVWSDVTTSMRGSISSRGGAVSGDGGLVEVSGMSLDFNGFVDTSAVNGDTGWLLLDPVGIRIVRGPFFIPAIPGNDPVLTITDGALNFALLFNNVLLATTPSRASSFSGIGNVSIGRANDDSIVVDRFTSINTRRNTLFFSTSTVDLYSNIQGNVAGGLASGATLPPPLGPVKDPSVVNVYGSGSFASGDPQDAVDIVGLGGTINLGRGIFRSFVVDKAGVTINGRGALTSVTTLSPAITVAADNVTVQNLNLLGTGSVGDIGVLLDGVASPDLTGTTISNVNIFNMDDGIASQGDIGDGNALTTDLTVSGLAPFAPALFQDFLDSAIHLTDTDGDVVVKINDVAITDGFFDFDSMSTLGDGINLGSIGGADIDRVSIFNAGGDGLHIDDVSGNVNVANVLFTGITGVGLNVEGIVAPNSDISLLQSLIGSVDDGVQFDGLIENATVAISESVIDSSSLDGIQFNGELDDSEVTIDRNSVSGNVNGISVNGGLSGTDFFASSNAAIRGDTANGIVFGDTISQSSNVQVDNNLLVTGDLSGILFGGQVVSSSIDINKQLAVSGNLGDGIRFDDFVILSDVDINDNGAINSTTGRGVSFNGPLVLSQLNIDRNGAINASGDGVFLSTVGSSELSITSNGLINSSAGTGILVNGQVGASQLNIDENLAINGLANGVSFNESIAGSDLSITGNGAINSTAGRGVSFNGPVAFTGLSIDRNGAINSSGDAVFFNDSFTNSELSISRNGLINSTAGAGILFNGLVGFNDAGISIESNGAITGLVNGIAFNDLFTASELSISNNGAISSTIGEGVSFNGPVSLSEIEIESNGAINGLANGIAFNDSFTTSRLRIDDNLLIGSGTGDGIAFNGPVALSLMSINGNGTIGGFGNGVSFNDSLSASLLNINDNLAINSVLGDGIAFNGPITAGLLSISNNGLINSIAGDGVAFNDNVTLSGLLLANNNVNSFGGDGIVFGGDVDLSAIGVVVNRVNSGGEAIQFSGDVERSLVAILGNQLFTQGTGIAFSDLGGVDTVVDDSLVIVAGNNITGPFLNPAASPVTGIQFEGIGGVSTVLVLNNNVEEAAQDGVLIENEIADAALLRIQGNTLGAIGAPLGSGAVGDNGIEINGVSSTRGVQILDNEVFGSFHAIGFGGDISNSNIEITNNPILSGELGSGVNFEGAIAGTSNVLIDNNMIEGMSGINMDGLASITDSSTFDITNNSIFAQATGSGIQLQNLGSSETVLIDNNTINGGLFGVNIMQSSNLGSVGSVQLSNLTIDGADTGIQIQNSHAANSLETTLQQNVEVVGGNTGLIFDGPGLSLTGDTLGNTSFVGTGGNFIELRNGALFEPGMPTLIDATGVNFDGIDSNTIAGFLEIESRVIHFIDDPTLGLIWPGFPIKVDNLVYDRFGRYTDWFETIQLLIDNGYTGTIGYGNGGNSPNSNEFQNGIIPQQNANSYDVFGN